MFWIFITYKGYSVLTNRATFLVHSLRKTEHIIAFNYSI